MQLVDQVRALRPATIQGYRKLIASLQDLPPPQRREIVRLLARTDLFFLLWALMGRKDMEHPWLLARAREVEAAPDGHLDLWARGHYKSTLITFGKTVQDILASHGDDPLAEWNGLQPTFGIFSHTRPIAKAFLRQIKHEFESSFPLRELFPDVLYWSPRKQSPQWSEDNGIVVKRTSNPKEATIEAWGLVDGQPTSKHFNVLIWDDCVTRESVTNPDMIRKTTDAYELSTNLGDNQPRRRMIGTRYHFADSYRTLLEREAFKPRIHRATKDGMVTGEPVFLTPEQYEQKVREMGPYTASAQLLMNPIADSKQTFLREWLTYYDDMDPVSWRAMNRVLLCDPASSKKKHSDWTAQAVIGLGPDGCYYLLDMVRDRFNMKERIGSFINLHRRWQPQRAGYEKYGLQSDIEYLEEVQKRENYRFTVQELGGPDSKLDRGNRLIPWFADKRFVLPRSLYYTQHDGRTVDLVQAFIEEELLAWPVPAKDDLIDVTSRVFDVDNLHWPRAATTPKPQDGYKTKQRATTWMSR